MQSLDFDSCSDCAKQLLDAGDELVCPNCGIVKEKEVLEAGPSGTMRIPVSDRQALGSYMGSKDVTNQERFSRGLAESNSRYEYLKVVSDSSGRGGGAAPTCIKTIEAYPLRSAYDNETKVALLRRLVPLTQGQAGKALSGAGPLKFEELLGAVVCVELGHMRDVQSRAVFSDVMLKMIYEEKVRRKGTLDHLTLVEEARNIAPARRAEDPPTVGERMISELRKFGEAMIFVAQFPTHVAAEIVKNSGTKIVHRLAWPDDVALIGDSLGLNQKQREHLTRLKVGEAVVGLARIQKPILVQVRADRQSSPESRDLSFLPES